MRAKRKIRDAGIPYRIPTDEEMPERLDAVLTVVYLIFNEGYVATTGDNVVRASLCDDAIRLGDSINRLLPDEPEVLGVNALMRLIHARRDARAEGVVLLADQDRSRWRHDEIGPALDMLERAIGAGRPGPYQLQAAIAALHAEAVDFESTDWHQIRLLYDRLLSVHSTPVVALNRAVAIAMAEGNEQGLAALESVAAELSDYPWYPLGTRRVAVADGAVRRGNHLLPPGHRPNQQRRHKSVSQREVGRADLTRLRVADALVPCACPRSSPESMSTAATTERRLSNRHFTAFVSMMMALTAIAIDMMLPAFDRSVLRTGSPRIQPGWRRS